MIVRDRGDTSHRERYTGANCSGTDVTANRVLTLANTSLSKNEVITVGGAVQTLNTDYTITNSTSGTQVTFIGIIQNVQKIEVLYFTKE